MPLTFDILTRVAIRVLVRTRYTNWISIRAIVNVARSYFLFWETSLFRSVDFILQNLLTYTRDVSHLSVNYRFKFDFDEGRNQKDTCERDKCPCGRIINPPLRETCRETCQLRNLRSSFRTKRTTFTCKITRKIWHEFNIHMLKFVPFVHKVCIQITSQSCESKFLL